MSMNGYRAPLQLVVYCYRQGEQGPEFLYLKSGEAWGALVGAPEKGEDLKVAALREVHEACGLKLPEARQLDYLSSAMVEPQNRHFYHPGLQRIDQYVFIVEASKSSEIHLSASYSDFAWKPADEGLKLLKLASHKEALQVCKEEI